MSIRDRQDEDTREKHTFLHAEKSRIMALPEWPFGAKSFVGSLVSSSAAALPILLSPWIHRDITEHVVNTAIF